MSVVEMKRSLLDIINDYGSVSVSDEMMERVFGPVYTDPLKDLALALSGNRPQETRKEIINVFCKQNNVEYKELFGGCSGISHLFYKQRA